MTDESAVPVSPTVAAVGTRASRPRLAWRSKPFATLLLVAFVVGAALRAWQIDIQVLIDDEWHAIHKLLRSGPFDILTHLGYADYSIPLTLYYQWLYRTIGLSEWAMHVPPLVAGIGLLLLGPRLLARWVALPTRALWTAVMAISPLLVYHSKVARPYALTSLLTFVAVVSFQNGWQGRRARDAWIYVVATTLAAWLHPITMTFTLAPFLYYGVRALHPLDRRDLARLSVLGFAVVLPLGLALLAPFMNDWTEFSQKAGRDHVTLESLYRTALMLAGTGSPLVGICFWATVPIGVRQLVRRDRVLAGYLATVVAVPTVVIASSGAEWISHPLVLARYLIPALPFVLLFAAEGVVAMIEYLRYPVAQAGVAGALVAALFFTGPIVAEWRFPNQFWGHLRYQFDYDPAHNPYVQLVPKDPIPAFYSDLARRPPGSITLIEMPWRPESHFNPLSLYQGVHHQLIRIGLVTGVCGTYDFGQYPEERKGMHLRELVHLSAILRGETGEADYLVVHIRPRNVAADPGPMWPDVTGCLATIEGKFGAPTYRDDEMLVFALPHLSSLGNSRRTVQQ